MQIHVLRVRCSGCKKTLVLELLDDIPEDVRLSAKEQMTRMMTSHGCRALVIWSPDETREATPADLRKAQRARFASGG